MPKKGFTYKNNLDLSKYSKEVLKKMDKEIIKTGYAIDTEAKRNVTVNEGRLKDSINTEIGGQEIKIGAYVDYASNVEFGRAPGKTPPPSSALHDWVRLKLRVKPKDVKGVSFVIAKSIGKKGVKAQPFLYPAFKIKTHDLEQRLLKIALNETAK